MSSNKEKSKLPFRLNILFFIIFILFAVLIIQLGIVQILDGEAAQEEIDRTVQERTKIPVPRGLILDRNNEVIVENKARYSITYTPPKGVQAEDRLKLAKKLVKYIDMNREEDLKSVTFRNKQEYWYLENIDEATSRLSEDELKDLDDVEQYQLLLKERITEEDVADYSDDELEIIAIKKELDKAYALTPQIIKNDHITKEEYARVAEHLDDLPGVNATTDWERKYNYDETFNSFIGSITSQEQGIPKEKQDYFLTRGYSRNDRVGKSGLEEYYEEYLRGRKEQVEYTTTKAGTVIDSKIAVEGERGKDLVLTIDMELQKQVDDVVSKQLKAVALSNRFANEATGIAMNPKTGEILAVSSHTYDRQTGKVSDTGYKALYDAHPPGSTVKGATVLAGLDSGAISPNQVFYDSPIKIAGTPQMGSYTRLGAVNDISALKRSSNVYMFYTALRMGGEYRYPFPQNAGVRFDFQGLLDLRNYYEQFGLGVKTGVDFPFEATGYEGPEPVAGNAMHFSIGQYDTYTALQMVQYVSTIANDGYRVRPHFLKTVHDPSVEEGKLGPVYKSISTDVMNRVDMDLEHIKRVQEGFRQAFQSQGGTGYSSWAGKSYSPAGKTGTAETEVFVDGVKYNTENLALVGYAPFDEPEIAFAVIVPNLSKNGGRNINHNIGTGILDAYFDIKEKRAKEE
ncbi:MAG TPA: penicillin-binding protein 2 [Bacillota bacterium]|nr:penicillin-binding protein 2 [Bacillota bacterium]